MLQPIWTEIYQSASRKGLVVDAGYCGGKCYRGRTASCLSLLHNSVFSGGS